VSFKLKTIIGIALIEAILLLILISMTLDYLRTSNYEGLSKRAHTTATLFATTTKDAVLSYDLASLEAFVSEVLKNPDLKYARVLGPRLELFASGGDPIALERAFITDYSVENVNDGIFDTSAEIVEAGVVYGRVQLGLDIAPILEVISEAQQRSAIIGIAEMLLVALFSLILGSYLTGQLKGLQAAAKSISRGDLAVNVPVKGRDEIADVAKAFNAMAKNLQNASERRDLAEQELQELNRSLEVRVEERTEQLQHKNRELQNANNEIKAAQAKLLQSEKMASLGLLAAGIAHEINNPMSFVISNLSSLQKYQEHYDELLTGYRLLSERELSAENEATLMQLKAREQQLDMAFIEEDVPDLLNDTREGALRVKDIVKGLKEFCHLDQDDSFTLYDVNQCVKTTLKMINNQLKYHCEIQTQLSAVPTTLISVGKINQVLMNILINAGQSIEHEGIISIATAQVEQRIKIEIKDTGSGIRADKMGKLFDPFYTTKAIGEGTGLGLSISYGIMEEHGGSIEVSSLLNEGSCFTLWLPINTKIASNEKDI